MKTAALIVTWNSVQDVEASVGRLLDRTCLSDVLVVDNGSRDNTVGTIRSRWPRVKVIENGRNLGFSGGNNVGLECLIHSYDAVFLLNADLIIEADFAQACIMAMERDPRLGVVGPVVLDADESRTIQCAGGDCRMFTARFPYRHRGRKYVTKEGVERVAYILGAAMLVRVKALHAVGCFDEEYFPAYVEEVDLCYRIRRAGYDVGVLWSAAVKHIGQRSAGNRATEFRRMVRHRCYFAMKHLRGVALASALLTISVHAVLFRWKSQVTRASL